VWCGQIGAWGGCHQLSLSVNGEFVAGSPLPVLIWSGQPSQVWNGIRRATGIATNVLGEIFISEWGGDIVKLDEERKKSVFIKKSEIPLSNLYGIACDSEGNLYCTDEDTNKVLRCDKNGRSVRVFEVEQESGPGHRGVAVVGEEVMLCACYVIGTDMIYNNELEYVRRITHADMGAFSSISADTDGNLYVTDMNCYLVRVFTTAGVLLRSIGCDGKSGEIKLKKPWGVGVAGQSVYITSHYSHEVSMFTMTGGLRLLLWWVWYPRRRVQVS